MLPSTLNFKTIFLETLATTLDTRSVKSHSPNLDSQAFKIYVENQTLLLINSFKKYQKIFKKAGFQVAEGVGFKNIINKSDT